MLLDLGADVTGCGGGGGGALLLREPPMLHSLRDL
jgi:hypothetical protein